MWLDGDVMDVCDVDEADIDGDYDGDVGVM